MTQCYIVTARDRAGHAVEACSVDVNGYREGVSFEAFRSGFFECYKNKLFAPNKSRRYDSFRKLDWSVTTKEETEGRRDHNRLFFKEKEVMELDPLPSKKFNNPISFFDYIGYDRKKRKIKRAS